MPEHLKQLEKSVKKVLEGRDGIRRLMVSMPPRHGKSEYCSKYLPSWYLGKYPNRRVILTSYEASFAASWGRKARNLLEEHGMSYFGRKVAMSPSAADQWEIDGHEGGMMTAGAGGAITGKGAHLALIDDPIKNSEEASSQTMRDKVWDWYQSTLYTRLEPDGVIIVIQTRWHSDDLCGRLINEANNGGEPWRMLSFPALDEQDQPLWPERYSLKDLQRTRKAVGPYTWGALYQQNPTPREGSLFKVNRLQFLDAEPVGLRTVRAWDLASTENDGDYTSGVKMGKDADGRIIVCNVKRGQWATDERDRWMRQTAELDGVQCRIRLPQDPGQAGKSQALFMTRLLAGFPVTTQPVSGDKITRADPFSSQVNAGNVWLVRGEWNKDYIEELRQFDKGKHDDSVDASSDAFNALSMGRITALVANTQPKDESAEQDKFRSLRNDDYVRDVWEKIARDESLVPQWRDSLNNFRNDMGDRPTELHTLRVRNKLDFYGPSNCYWGTEDETEPPKPVRKRALVAN